MCPSAPSIAISENSTAPKDCDVHATAGKRLAAFALDYLVIAGYIVVLSIVSSLVWQNVGGVPDTTQGGAWRYDLLAFVTLVLPVILYFALSEASRAQATLGKRRVGLRVETGEGHRLSTGRSLLRSSLKFLPWQIAHTALFHVPGWPVAPEAPPPWVFGGFALALGLVVFYLAGLFVSPVHRTLYDRVAGTRVVWP